MTDLDDLINDGPASPEETPEEDFAVVEPETPSVVEERFLDDPPEIEPGNFITAMCVHNQHLYIATISGGLYRNFLRQKGNKWEPVDLPPDFDG